MIKNNLQKWRTYKNLTQEELKVQLNISVHLIRKIEFKQHYPKYQVREKICKFFGISQEQMFYKED